MPTSVLPEVKLFVLRNVVKFRRKFSQLSSLPIVVVTETNGRFDGDWVSEVLTHHVNLTNTVESVGAVEFFSDDCIKRLGTVKTIQRTIQYIIFMTTVLEGSRLLIHEDFSTCNRKVSADGMLMQMIGEMTRFRWPDRDPGNPRYGSAGGRGGYASAKFSGQVDDMAICLQMFVYFVQILRTQRIKALRLAERRGSQRGAILV